MPFLSSFLLVSFSAASYLKLLYTLNLKKEGHWSNRISMEQPNQQQHNPNGRRGFARYRGRPRGHTKPNEEGSSSSDALQIPPTTSQEAASASRNDQATVLPSFLTFIRNIQQNPRVQQNVGMSRLSLGHPVFGTVDGEIRDAYLLSVTASNSETKVRGLAFKPGRFPPIRHGANASVPSIDLHVGQLVFGVVDGEDQKAYLVTLRSMDCDSVMRGLVFKPGHFLPVTPENDAALGIPFVNKNWSPF